MDARWVEWVRRLQAIAQNGLTFSKDPFDRERYEQVRSVAEEILASYSDIDTALITNLLRGEQGYATPKIDVRGAVFHEHHLLLVRERSDGLWALPGGWADVGDSPTEAVVREIREESGFETKVCKLVALYDRNKQGHPPMLFHVYKAFFLCDLVGGSASISHETSEVGFFGREEIPSLSTARVTLRQVERLFEHHMNRDLPTEFD
ncbi:MAG TPA: NUDIX hydrolase [Candidatus Binatia bacterium]|nr:NUDIX hydrolase [Candidatus Binatia bacterium]